MQLSKLAKHWTIEITVAILCAIQLFEVPEYWSKGGHFTWKIKWKKNSGKLFAQWQWGQREQPEGNPCHPTPNTSGCMLVKLTATFRICWPVKLFSISRSAANVLVLYSVRIKYQVLHLIKSKNISVAAAVAVRYSYCSHNFNSHAQMQQLHVSWNVCTWGKGW